MEFAEYQGIPFATLTIPKGSQPLAPGRCAAAHMGFDHEIDSRLRRSRSNDDVSCCDPSGIEGSIRIGTPGALLRSDLGLMAANPPGSRQLSRSTLSLTPQKCPDEIARILLEILGRSLLRIRALGGEKTADVCTAEADHVHNIPSLITHYSKDRLRYYLEVERPCFLKACERLQRPASGYEDLWRQLELAWQKQVDNS